METRDDPKDLARFGEVGREAPEIARKLFDACQAALAAGAIRGGATLVHGVQLRAAAGKVSL